MPIVSYEEACRQAGITTAECDARAAAEAAQRDQAALACALAFHGDTAHQNECISYCSIARKPVHECVIQARVYADEASAQHVQQVHVLSAIAGVALVIGVAYITSKRSRG